MSLAGREDADAEEAGVRGRGGGPVGLGGGKGRDAFDHALRAGEGRDEVPVDDGRAVLHPDGRAEVVVGVVRVGAAEILLPRREAVAVRVGLGERVVVLGRGELESKRLGLLSLCALQESLWTAYPPMAREWEGPAPQGWEG